MIYCVSILGYFVLGIIIFAIISVVVDYDMDNQAENWLGILLWPFLIIGIIGGKLFELMEIMSKMIALLIKKEKNK